MPAITGSAWARIICEIQQERVVVLVVAVGHRNKVYG
jgi:mRNA-degrading endonuclease RelE of RelBE toxin-antitoxin system